MKISLCVLKVTLAVQVVFTGHVCTCKCILGPSDENISVYLHHTSSTGSVYSTLCTCKT